MFEHDCFCWTLHVRLCNASVKRESQLLQANFSSFFNFQICCLKGQRGLPGQPTFDGIHIVNHYTGGVDDAYRSSDEDGAAPPQQRGRRLIRLHPALGDSDSEEDGETLRLTVPQNNHKSTTVWSAPAWPDRGRCGGFPAEISSEIWSVALDFKEDMFYIMWIPNSVLFTPFHPLVSWKKMVVLDSWRNHAENIKDSEKIPPSLTFGTTQRNLCNKTFFTHFIWWVFIFYSIL